jgi:hypothetical protein
MCVADEADPAVKLVHRLQERYPHVPSKLLIGESALRMYLHVFVLYVRC